MQDLERLNLLPQCRWELVIGGAHAGEERVATLGRDFVSETTFSDYRAALSSLPLWHRYPGDPCMTSVSF